jgi:small subunit ribosomal protein S18
MMRNMNIKLKVSSKMLKKKTKKVSSFPKKCRFCLDSQLKETLDYKNASLLKGFLTECGKILPARISGNCATCQRHLMNAIKKSRIMALIPFCSH